MIKRQLYLLLLIGLFTALPAAAGEAQSPEALFQRFAQQMDNIICIGPSIPDECRANMGSDEENEALRIAFFETVQAIKKSSSSVDEFIARKIRAGTVPAHLSEYLLMLETYPEDIENALAEAAQSRLSDALSSSLQLFIPNGRFEKWIPRVIARRPKDRRSLQLQSGLLRRAISASPNNERFVDLCLERAPRLLKNAPPRTVLNRARYILERPLSDSHRREVFLLLGDLWVRAPQLRAELLSCTEGSVENEATLLHAALQSEQYKKARHNAKVQRSPEYIDTIARIIELLGRADFDLFERYFASGIPCPWAVNPVEDHSASFPEGVRRILFDYQRGYRSSCSPSTQNHAEAWTRFLARLKAVDSADRNRRLALLVDLDTDLMPRFHQLSFPTDLKYEANLIEQQLKYLKSHADAKRMAEDCNILLPKIHALIEADGDNGGPLYQFSSNAELTQACGDALVRFVEKSTEKTVVMEISFLKPIRIHLNEELGKRFDAAVQGICGGNNDPYVCVATDLYAYYKEGYKEELLTRALIRAANLQNEKRELAFLWVFWAMKDRIGDSSREELAEELATAAEAIRGRSDQLDLEIDETIEQLRKYVPFMFSM